MGTFVEYGALEHSFVRTDFTTSSSTLADTNFTFPVKAGEVRAIDYDGIAECDSTGGSAYGIAAPAGSTIDAWLEARRSAWMTVRSSNSRQ